MRFFARAGLSALAIVVALFLVFVGAILTSNASDLPPSSRGAATTFMSVAVAGLALSLFLAGALLGKAERLAKLAFSGVLVVEAALLVLWLTHCWSSCGPGG